jgi:N-methylhydantoinase A
MSDGTALASPEAEEILPILQRLEQDGIEAVAICFLFSFLEPKHERYVKKIISEKRPDLTVSISSDVIPEYREYERSSTVCANAYISKVLHEYTAHMDSALSGFGLNDRLRLLQSNGGIATIEALQDRWITTVMSGPAGGVTASAYLARQKKIPNIISMDIGGTSCDICLIKDYLPDWTSEADIEGLPIRSPMIDVKSIGAGGGSIIWVDSGGAMRVGPKSTGSDPGPVCFNLGGKEPSITDAHLVIGAVQPVSFIEKGLQIDVGAAERALTTLGKPFGLSAEQVATGAIAVMNHNIAHAIRMAAMTELSGYALLAYGGAGPLHACLIAEQTGIPRILLPEFAGVFSANGAALADYRYDFVQGRPVRLDDVQASELDDIFDTLLKKADHKLAELPNLSVRIDRSLELRYVGQSFEINVPVGTALKDRLDIEAVIGTFHHLHEDHYGYSDSTEPVELVNARISCFAMTSKPVLQRIKTTTTQSAQYRTASILTPGKSDRKTYRILDRAEIQSGQSVEGPCLILSRNSTTLVLERWRGLMHRDGTIELEKGETL